jgi:Flp pilus assembly pilin Flp
MDGFSQALPGSSRRSPRRRRLRALRTLLLRDERGQDLVEFALIGSWISIVAILALQAIGPELVRIWVLIRFTLSNLRTTLS